MENVKSQQRQTRYILVCSDNYSAHQPIDNWSAIAQYGNCQNMTPFNMISGAGHDTALIAGLTEAGMIFVPSRDGRSHCPQEYTRMEDIVLGCEILLDAVVELAA